MPVDRSLAAPDGMETMKQKRTKGLSGRPSRHHLPKLRFGGYVGVCKQRSGQGQQTQGSVLKTKQGVSAACQSEQDKSVNAFHTSISSSSAAAAGRPPQGPAPSW